MPRYLVGTHPSDLYATLEDLEFAVGSCGLSRRQALIEIGFPEDQVDRLMAERVSEDVGK